MSQFTDCIDIWMECYTKIRKSASILEHNRPCSSKLEDHLVLPANSSLDCGRSIYDFGSNMDQPISVYLTSRSTSPWTRTELDIETYRLPLIFAMKFIFVTIIFVVNSLLSLIGLQLPDLSPEIIRQRKRSF